MRSVDLTTEQSLLFPGQHGNEQFHCSGEARSHKRNKKISTTFQAEVLKRRSSYPVSLSKTL